MPRLDKPERLLLLLALIPCLWVSAEVFLAWAERLTYPYDLEWMEGGVLAHAWRVQHFKSLYVEPGPDFFPMIYPPGYPTVLAILGAIPGLSHPLGRLVSICGTLASVAALVYASRKHLDTPIWGLIAGGLYLGMYPRSGTFYDLVRPDGLHMGLLTWAVVQALDDDDKGARRSGILLFLAFVVKHNAAWYGFPLALGVAARGGLRRAALFTAWAAGLGLGFTVFMYAMTGGLFTTWLLDVPASHPIVYDRVIPGTVREVGHAMGLSLAVVCAWVLALGPRNAPRLPVPMLIPAPLAAGALSTYVLNNMPAVSGIERPHFLEATAAYALIGVGVVWIPLVIVGMLQSRKINGDLVMGVALYVFACVSTGLMRGHHGGFINVFMFLHWLTAAMMALALYDLTRHTPAIPGHALAAVLAGAQAAQLGWRMDVDRLIPSEADRAAGDAIVEYLKTAEPPILSPFNPWLAAQAGHEPGWHLIALWDIRHPNGPFREDVARIFRAIKEHHWGTIVDSDEGAELGYVNGYEKVKSFQSNRTTMMPKVGWRARPNVIWTPRQGGARPAPPDDAPDPPEVEAPEPQDEP
ncbi:MAG TPA: hypothetical protein PKA64_19405 [Myxococcota bacterium]|nr:hypothetical protein [Myxococcota bacterium]